MQVLSSEKEKIQWFAMNVYDHSNAAVEAYLMKSDNIQFFNPKRYVIKNVAGRSRRQLVPLIPSMTFVRGTFRQVNELQKFFPKLGFARMLKDGKMTIMVIPDNQMDEFIKISSHYEEDLTYYRPEEISLEKGTRIRIIGGIYEGIEGTLLKVKGKKSKRLVVKIDGLVAIAASHITPEFIQVL